MALTLTDEQRLIRDEARRLVADRASSERVRHIVENGTGHDADLWSTLSRELGWCAMAIPEEFGGLGLGITELALLLEATGERLAPVPLWSTTCLATQLLIFTGTDEAKSHYLPRIANGEFAATVAGLDNSARVCARRNGTGYVLDGVVDQVPDLAASALVLVLAKLDEHLACFALEPGAGHTYQLYPSLDATRQIGQLTLSETIVPGEVRIDSDGVAEADLAAVLNIARLGLAAEQVGATSGALDITLSYLAERVQFGRTIASFQAIKHRCAKLLVDFAEARSMMYGAAANIGRLDQDESRQEVAGARAIATELLYRASEEAIQLHGGVGFTWEYDPHLYFKRAQSTWSLFGGPDEQLEVIAARLLDEGALR